MELSCSRGPSSLIQEPSLLSWTAGLPGTLQGIAEKSLRLDAFLSLLMETRLFSAVPSHRGHTHNHMGTAELLSERLLSLIVPESWDGTWFISVGHSTWHIVALAE